MGGKGSGRKPSPKTLAKRFGGNSGNRGKILGRGVQAPNYGGLKQGVRKSDSSSTGSVLFYGNNGEITEDNSNLFWDDSNNRLGIGTSSPSSTLDVSGDISVGGNVAVESTGPITNATRVTGEYMLTADNELDYTTEFSTTGTKTISELPSNTVAIQVYIRMSRTGNVPGIAYRRNSADSQTFQELVGRDNGASGNGLMRGVRWLFTDGNGLELTGVTGSMLECKIVGYKVGG